MSRLGWLLADELAPLSSVEPRPWTDVPDDLIGQTARIVRPLVRALLLAGYRTYRLDFVRSRINPEVISLTPGGLTAGTVASLGAPTPSTGSGVVLTVADLVHDRAVVAAEAGGWIDPQASEANDLRSVFSHALHVTASPQAPWTGLEPGVGGNIVLWAGDWLTPEDGERIRLNEAWANEISRCVGDIANDIRDALHQRLALGGVTPLSRAGLLWLFNPLFWYARDAGFPGDTFDAAVVGEPVEPLAWPAVTSAGARDLDPVALLEAGQVPPDPDVALLVTQASLLVPILADAGFSHVVVGRLIFGRTFEFVDGGRTVHGWNDSRDNDFKALLKASPDVSDVGTRSRLLISAVRALGGREFANKLFYRKPNWLEALMDLAELGLITPAGYPADATETTGQSDVDPVRPIYYPASGVSGERVVLEVKGLPAVTVAATALCEVPLLQAFAWDFLEAAPPQRLLTLMVVAGPGVEVTPGVDRGLRWELEVVRVWHHSAIPPRGARVQPELILAPYPLAWEPTTPDRELYPSGLPLYGLQVFPLPQGVALEYPIPTRVGDTPDWRVTATAPEGSGRSRIAFSVTFGHSEFSRDDYEPGEENRLFAEPSMAVVSLWVSPDVSVRLETLRGNPSPAPSSLLEAWTIADPALIPLQGTCLAYPPIVLEAGLGPPLPVATELPQEATRLSFPPEPHDDTYADVLRFMIDSGIGCIPVVGDVVDVVELSVSLYTGKDKWGRPMTRFEQLVMLGCLLVPGVSNGAAKLFAREAEQAGLSYVLALSRRRNEPLLEFVGAVRAGLPSQIQRRLDDLVGSLPPTTLARLGPQRREVLEALGQGIPLYLDAAQRLGEAVSPQLANRAQRFMLIDLLTDAVPMPGAPMFTTREFWLPALREPFQQWCRATGRIPGDEAVRQWVTSRTGGAQGVQRAILEALLGSDAIDRAILEGVRPPVRTPPLAAPWECLASMVYRGESAMDAAAYAETGLEVVAGQTRWLAGETQRLAGLGPSRLSVDQRLLNFADGSQMTVLANRVETLLRNLCPQRPMRPTVEELQELLLGANRSIDPRDMAEVLMRGMHRIDQLLIEMSQATNVPGLTTDAFLRFTGRESTFKDLLTGASPQHASLFEVRAAAEEFIRRSWDGDMFPHNGFMMQPMYAPGQKGPDLVRLFEGMLQIVESKSWTRAWMAGQPGGSLVRQIERFIDYAKSGHRFTLNGSTLPTHRTIILRFNPDEFAALRRIPIDDAQQQIDDFLLGLEPTLDEIRSIHKGWDVFIQQDPLYTRFDR